MRLLVVEDDPTISRFLVKGLREDQHLVDLAEDGDAAEASGARGRLRCHPAGRHAARTGRLRRVPPAACPGRRHAHPDGDRPRRRRRSCARPGHRRRRLPGQALRVRRGRWRGCAPSPVAAAPAACRPSSAPAPLSLDQEAHQASVAGGPVPLTATEYRLLEYLMRRAGTIVSRDQLAEHVWGGDYDPVLQPRRRVRRLPAQEARAVRPLPTRSGPYAASATCWHAARHEAQAALLPRPADAPLDRRVRPAARLCQHRGLHGRARVYAQRDLDANLRTPGRHRDRLVHRRGRRTAPARTADGATRWRRLHGQVRAVLRPRRRASCSSRRCCAASACSMRRTSARTLRGEHADHAPSASLADVAESITAQIRDAARRVRRARSACSATNSTRCSHAWRGCSSASGWLGLAATAWLGFLLASSALEPIDRITAARRAHRDRRHRHAAGSAAQRRRDRADDAPAERDAGPPAPGDRRLAAVRRRRLARTAKPAHGDGRGDRRRAEARPRAGGVPRDVAAAAASRSTG